jgi:hypothetical protein
VNRAGDVRPARIAQPMDCTLASGDTTGNGKRRALDRYLSESILARCNFWGLFVVLLFK